MTNILNFFQFNFEEWKLFPGPFMILRKLRYKEVCLFVEVDV